MSEKYMYLFKRGNPISVSVIDLEVEECDEEYLFDVAVESSKVIDRDGKRVLSINGVDVIEMKDNESKEDALSRAFTEGVVYSYCSED